MPSSSGDRVDLILAKFNLVFPCFSSILFRLSYRSSFHRFSSYISSPKKKGESFPDAPMFLWHAGFFNFLDFCWLWEGFGLPKISQHFPIVSPGAIYLSIHPSIYLSIFIFTHGINIVPFRISFFLTQNPPSSTEKSPRSSHLRRPLCRCDGRRLGAKARRRDAGPWRGHGAPGDCSVPS